MLELYNEQLRDLMVERGHGQPRGGGLAIMDDPRLGTRVHVSEAALVHVCMCMINALVHVSM